MKQTLKVTKDKMRDFLHSELCHLNREIIAAAKDGDIIRGDVEDTKIDVLENLCFFIDGAGIRAFIEKKEIYDFDIPINGVNCVRQYHLYYDGMMFNCGAYEDAPEAEKKGA